MGKSIFNSGYIKSVLDGTELDLDLVYGTSKSQDLPEELDYSKYESPLRNVKDQGQTSMCVCYTLDYVLQELEFMSNPMSKFELDKNEVYDIRSNKPKDGMQIKEALEYVKKSGYKFGKDTRHNILDYGKLTNTYAIRKSLVANGPCLFALPVYDGGREAEFWKGNEFCGGHAICCVGYNRHGFILENSWGILWGDAGKTLLPYDCVGKLYEAWGVLK